MSGQDTTGQGPATDAQATEAAPAAPVLRVVNPDATPEEVAALVAVFSALGGGAPRPRPPVRTWSAPSRLVRRPAAHGRGAWRASGLPL